MTPFKIWLRPNFPYRCFEKIIDVNLLIYYIYIIAAILQNGLILPGVENNNEWHQDISVSEL